MKKEKDHDFIITTSLKLERLMSEYVQTSSEKEKDSLLIMAERYISDLDNPELMLAHHMLCGSEPEGKDICTQILIDQIEYLREE